MELGRGQVAVSKVAVTVIEVCAFIMTIEIDIILLNDDNADDFEQDVNDSDYDGNDGDDVDMFNSGGDCYDDKSH